MQLSGNKYGSGDSLAIDGVWHTKWADVCVDGRLRFAYSISMGKFPDNPGLAEIDIGSLRDGQMEGMIMIDFPPGAIVGHIRFVKLHKP